MAIPTVPPIVLLKKQNTGASATRTGHSVRPAPRNQVLSAIDRIREVNDCFLKCGRFLLCAHVQMIAPKSPFCQVYCYPEKAWPQEPRRQAEVHSGLRQAVDGSPR